MQATGTFREARFSKGVALTVLAMASAVLLGGAGGYAVRSLNTVTSPAHVQAAADINQGGPQSDLTRALPTAAPAMGGPQSDLTRALPTAAPAVREPRPGHGQIP